MTMQLLVPLSIRKRNGRPMIVPPAEMAPDIGAVDPHIMKAIAKAWICARKLVSGAFSTMSDVAETETSNRWRT
jgi:hypothetical protein